MADPPLSAVQRRYLGAFDVLLTARSASDVAGARRRMRDGLAAMFAEARGEPYTETELQEVRKMDEKTPSARQALELALDALREKESKLLRVQSALKDTRRDIKVLERTLRALNGTSNGEPPMPSEERKERLVAALRSADAPLSIADLATATGGGGQGLSPMLRAMERKGEVVRVEDGWAAAA